MRKKREREFRINLKSLEETLMFLEIKRIWINSSFPFEFLPLSGVTRWTKQAFSCSKFLSPGGQLWANTAFEGSQFYSIGVPKFYSWVNVISVYAYNDLG